MTAPPSSPIALIQLISEQTMPNLLPVLRLRPARLIHLTTPRTESRSSWIANAARSAGIDTTVETHALSAMPTVGETKEKVAHLIETARDENLTPVLNFTGGTKLMSLGAFVAALHPARIDSFYVDTQDRVFIDGQTGSGFRNLFGDDPSFASIVDRLTVPVVACAHGCDHVTDGENWRPLLPLAQYLFDHPEEERATHDALVGPEGLLRNGRQPRSPEEWLPLFDRIFPLPPEVARIAAELRLVVRLSLAGECRLPEEPCASLLSLVEARKNEQYLKNYDTLRITATDAASRPIRLLSGSWFEILIADRLEKAGRYRDIRWSAHTGSAGHTALEEDILAVEDVNILCISCKRSGNGLLGHLSELRDRTRTLGGTFARPCLAVLHPPRGKFLADLEQRARDLNVRLILREDLSTPDPFA